MAGLTSTCVLSLPSPPQLSTDSTLSLCATEQTPPGPTTSQGTLQLFMRSTLYTLLSCTVVACVNLCCIAAARSCTEACWLQQTSEATATGSSVAGTRTSSRANQSPTRHTLSAALCCIARSKLRIRPRNTKTAATVNAMTATILVLPSKGPMSLSFPELPEWEFMNAIKRTPDGVP